MEFVAMQNWVCLWMSTHLGMARRILMDDISHVGRWAEFDNLCGFLVDEEFLEDSPRDYEVPN